MPIEHQSSVRSRTRALDVTGEGLGVVGLDRDERLVPSHHLHDEAEGAERVHHATRCLEVDRCVDGEEHGVGASFEGRAERHPRSDPERPRFVGGGGDDAAFRRVAVAADDDRPAAELRPPEHLDGREELVEVDVEDERCHRDRSGRVRAVERGLEPLDGPLQAVLVGERLQGVVVSRARPHGQRRHGVHRHEATHRVEVVGATRGSSP